MNRRKLLTMIGLAPVAAMIRRARATPIYAGHPQIDGIHTIAIAEEDEGAVPGTVAALERDGWVSGECFLFNDLIKRRLMSRPHGMEPPYQMTIGRHYLSLGYHDANTRVGIGNEWVRISDGHRRPMSQADLDASWG